AFPQSIFDHWQIMSGVITEPGKVNDVVRALRKRKGLVEELPPLDRYLDKL
ncbi:translation elongation factor 2, partial [Kickxella alabastrina]